MEKKKSNNQTIAIKKLPKPPREDAKNKNRRVLRLMFPAEWVPGEKHLKVVAWNIQLFVQI